MTGSGGGVEGTQAGAAAASEGAGGTVATMFRRIDREKKGYIDLKNLEQLMKDDKTYFAGRDVNHIMDKYGDGNGRMTLEHFQTWWNSTYTTYNDDDGAMARLVEDAQEENSREQQLLDAIPEFASSTITSAPHNSNVAVSRS
jgi:hypothetical protein